MNLDPLNDFDCDGYRPIHHAVLANDRLRAEKLTRLGASIHALTEDGEGIISLAIRALAEKDAAEWLQWLRTFNVDSKVRNKQGKDALFYARERGYVMLVALLLE